MTEVHHSAVGHSIHYGIGGALVEGCPQCDWLRAEDERITDMLRDRYPGYTFDGRDGDIEEEDDEGRIEAEDLAREGWQDYLAWQETSH